LTDPHKMGRQAFRAGNGGNAKPWPISTPEGRAWSDGWMAEQKAHAEEAKHQEATMAKQLDESDGRATAGHNVANMHETMNRYFREMFDLDVAIDRAKETHVKPLQDQKKEKKKELRDAMDAKEADIKPWYQLYARKRHAEQFEEEEDGKKSLDMLRLGYEALREGEQLDYIFALDGDDGDQRQAAE